ncbi:BTB/POZ domain-containing protein [Ditylenchus destructor]|nr:BTB/POZ domain-containing protein [Ditylenchus destructor]
MIFGKCIGNASEAKGEIGLVVASIYESGDVANVIYYSPRKPLVLVPKSFFILKAGECRDLTNSQRLKRTISFVVGDEVEFELAPGSDRIVQWIRKSPDVLNVFLSEDNFLAKSIGIISPPNVKQDGLWTKDFDWVPLEPEQLRYYEPNVPINVTIVIDISFGDHDNAKCFMLEYFKPACTYKLLSIDSVSRNPDFLCLAPWKKITNLATDHDLAAGFEESTVISEVTNSDRLEYSYSANSRASSNERKNMVMDHDLAPGFEESSVISEDTNSVVDFHCANIRTSSNERSALRESQVVSSWTAENYATDDWGIIARYVFNIDKLRTEKALQSRKVIIGGAEWYLCIEDIGDSLRVLLCCNMDSEEFSYDTNGLYVLLGQKRVECEFNHCYASNQPDMSSLQYLFEQLNDSANGHISADNHVTVEAYFSFKRVRSSPVDVSLFSAPMSFRSDCVLVVEDTRVYVNKGLLSVYSAYFDELFNGDPGTNQSNEIVLTDVTVAEFKAMLSAIFPTEEQFVITESNVCSMLKRASQFRIPFFTGKCEEFLMTCPNGSDEEGVSLVTKLSLSEKYRLDELKNWCISQFKSPADLQALQMSEEFEKLDGEVLRAILKNISW